MELLPIWCLQARVAGALRSRGEVLDKLDFPVVESSYLLPVDDYFPNYFALVEHRHGKECSHAARLRKSGNILVGWVRSGINQHFQLLVSEQPRALLPFSFMNPFRPSGVYLKSDKYLGM
jgi:hypothetical protein